MLWWLGHHKCVNLTVWLSLLCDKLLSPVTAVPFGCEVLVVPAECCLVQHGSDFVLHHLCHLQSPSVRSVLCNEQCYIFLIFFSLGSYLLFATHSQSGLSWRPLAWGLSVPVNFLTASSNTMSVCVKKWSCSLSLLLLWGRGLHTYTNSLFLIAARRAERNHREDKGDGTEQWPLLWYSNCEFWSW